MKFYAQTRRGNQVRIRLLDGRFLMSAFQCDTQRNTVDYYVDRHAGKLTDMNTLMIDKSGIATRRIYLNYDVVNKKTGKVVARSRIKGDPIYSPEGTGRLAAK